MNKTVLIIEDDRFIGEMYVRSLRREGYVVDWVVGGNDGLAAAKSKTYDIILLDIMIPEKRGSEVLADLRGHKDLVPHSKIVVLTNFDQDDESRLAMQHRADGYLIKADLTPKKLLEILQTL